MAPSLRTAALLLSAHPLPDQAPLHSHDYPILFITSMVGPGNRRAPLMSVPLIEGSVLLP